MIRARSRIRLIGATLPRGLGGIVAVVLLTTLSVRSAQDPAPAKSLELPVSPAAVINEAAPPASHPKDEPTKSKLERTKSDAAELSALADQLRDELKEMNVNVLPLDVIQKTEAVEKLARKIKGEANAN